MRGIITTPILLIAFNRPKCISEVFEQVRKVKPTKLYYAVDGARNGKDEEDKVNACRDIIKQVDWDCEVHTLFRNKNVGCGHGPSDAISWAFENEDRLIVLEDDCVPSLSFFYFCEEMLERYENDTRVNMISGRSHQSGSIYFKDQDYIFTYWAHTWGWATWKRCWEQFDMMVSDIPDFLAMGGALNLLATKAQGKKINKGLQALYNHRKWEATHSWDSQWSYTRLKTGLGIVPCKNLIHNIGDYGTHSGGHSKVHDMPAEEMPETLRHPKFIIPNKGYEILHYKRHIKKSNNIIIRGYKKIVREFKSKFIR